MNAMRATGWTRRCSLLILGMLIATAACSYQPARLDLVAPTLATSTKIYAVDGTLITTLEAEENRELVPLDELPAHVADAVIAIEDARFLDHRGVDLRAVLRALRRNASAGEVVEGGSTITQQYVKNLLGENDRTVKRKLKEASLAFQLERHYTKERILEQYLNTIYLGNGAYGIQAAALEYFGVSAAELSLAQAAVIAGLIRSPSASDPYALPDRALARRNLVLQRMAELGLLTRAKAEAAAGEPLGLRVKDARDIYAAPHFVEQVKRFVLDDPRFGETPAERRRMLFQGGLRITTTLDPGLQAMAEDAVGKVRPDEPGPDAALVSIEPATGAVRALVGGRDYFSGSPRAKLDLATGGPGRPAGSSFKPFVLAAALEKGIPLERVYSAPTSMELTLPNEVWRVENYEGSGGGSADLRDATVRSYNTVYAQLVMEVGPEEAMRMASRLGIADRLQPFPSAVLGTNDVHVLSMASAYGTFATRGLQVDPTFVLKVTRSDGSVLYQHQARARRAVSRYVADQINSVLQEVMTRGTGTDARIGRPAAGKTGTGQAWRDAWFVGYTPDLVTAVWMGFADEGQRSMIPPATPFRITGGTWPAQIWQLFMTGALANVPVSDFAVPVPPTPPTTTVTLPAALDPAALLANVRGMRDKDAREALEAQGVKVRLRSVANDEYPPGVVVAQRPPARTPVSEVDSVTIDVANGKPASGEVPSVLGLTRVDALDALKRRGFRVEVIEEVEPGSIPPASIPDPAASTSPSVSPTSTSSTSTSPTSTPPVSVVWKQNPAGGRRAAFDQPVRIWVTP